MRFSASARLKVQSKERDEFPLTKYLENSNTVCYLVAPLFYNNELIGMLEASSSGEAVLNNQTIKKLEPVYTFLEMMCYNYITQFQNEIDALILERFTAL